MEPTEPELNLDPLRPQGWTNPEEVVQFHQLVNDAAVQDQTGQDPTALQHSQASIFAELLVCYRKCSDFLTL